MKNRVKLFLFKWSIHQQLQCVQQYKDDFVVLLQPLRWCCVDCVIYHERDVREEQHHTYMWREQAIIEWSWHVNSVACCHSAKLCEYAARDFRSQQYSVCMLTSSEKIRISDEAERVQSVSWPHIILCYCLEWSIEETGEIRVRPECLNFDVSRCIQIKNKVQLEEQNIKMYFCVI